MSLFKRIVGVVKQSIDDSKPIPSTEPTQNQQPFSFQFEPKASIPEAVAEEYLEFLWKISSEFLLSDIEDFELEFVEGLDIYNDTSHDCRITIITPEARYAYRILNFPSLDGTKFLSRYKSYYPQLADVVSRYLMETNSPLKVVAEMPKVREHELKDFKVWYTTEPEKYFNADWEDDDNPTPKFSRAEILSQLDVYAEAGLFKRLPEPTIDRGLALSLEYSLLVKQDLLWCFRYLVAPCCPRESSGYEDELESLIQISNGHLSCSQLEERDSENGTTVTATINGRRFKSTALPEEFSLKFVVELNAFLKEHFGTSFYLWNWERNPWEQVCFVYLDNTVFEKVKLLPNFEELDLILADFYEERM